MLSHRRKEWAALAALAAAALLALLAPRADAAQSAASGTTQEKTGSKVDEPPPGGGGCECDECEYTWAKGPKTCNCTDAPMVVDQCHSRSVDVKIGSTFVGTIGTGQSLSKCTRQRVKAGECVWTEYKFECCEGWFGWNCKPTGDTAQKKQAAAAGDCP